jgi:hypothetical protein
MEENLKTISDLLEAGEIVEPETIRKLIPEITETEFNRLMAMLVLTKQPFFWTDFHIFEDVTLALNDQVPNFNKLEGCAPEQIWYAVQVASRIRPKQKYSFEVQTYIKKMSEDYGLFIFPPAVGLSNPFYEEALARSINGPFPLGDDSPENIQAAKLLAIEHYLESKE